MSSLQFMTMFLGLIIAPFVILFVVAFRLSFLKVCGVPVVALLALGWVLLLIPPVYAVIVGLIAWFST